MDIHGGGQDLIFPHHTNEIAQSCAAHGHDDPKSYAKYWLHNGFLDFSGEKMSKSLGNVVLVHDLIKDYPGEVIRWALLSGHYRSPLNWTPELLEQSKKNLDRLYGLLRRASHIALDESYPQKPAHVFHSFLLEDLNTPGQLSNFFTAAAGLEGAIADGDVQKAIHLKSTILEMGRVLGILQQDPEDWFKQGASDDLTTQVEALLAERAAARGAKNWPESDRIRDALNALNVEVMDGPTGATWKLKGKA